MKIYLVCHEGAAVAAIASSPSNALAFAGMHNNLRCVDIYEAELDRPPERLILAGSLVYHKNMLNGDELWPSEEFRNQILEEGYLERRKEDAQTANDFARVDLDWWPE